MFRYTVVLVALAMMIALPALAQPEDEAAAPPNVNMNADDLTAAEVATQFTEQTGVQVAVTEWTGGSVTGELEDYALEDAVRSLGVVANSSWMRFYMLEKTPPEEPWTASELLIKLEETRNLWMESLTDEQRGELFGGFRGQGGQGGGPGGPPQAAQPAAEGAPVAAAEGAPAAEGDAPAEGQPAQEQRGQRQRPSMDGPGGAIAQPPRPEGEQEQDGRRFGGFGNFDDPIRGLLLFDRSDTITVELTDVPLQDALSAFVLKSRMLIVADEDLTGAVSLQLEDAPLDEALDAIAEASGAQWRVVYVVSEPRPLTEEEIAAREADRQQRREERFNEQWTEFWAMTADERAAEVQERVDRMERMAERIAEWRARRENDPNADPERDQRRTERMRRFGERMMERMVDYSNQLTPEQRLEIKPLLQAMQNMQNPR